MARQPRKPKPKFDALAILRSIAADPDVAAHARVGAAKALLQHDRDNAEAEPDNGAPRDHVTRRALQSLRLVQGGKSNG